MNTNPKSTPLHNKILFVLTIPVLVAMALLYFIWLTAYFDLNAVKVYKGIYGLADPKYNRLYEPLNPIINNTWVISVFLLPLIITYIIILKFKRQYTFSKIVLVTLLLCYSLLIGNFCFKISVGSRSGNPFSAMYWLMD